jgi:UDP-GlcNAc3NAcA epimerase
MIHLLTIVGARPQIIKAAAFTRAINSWNCSRLFQNEQITQTILHTGQHYDDNMSASFFAELDIPAPAIHLGVGGLPASEQVARMIMGIADELSRNKYDGVVLFGDTNSTLAGAIAAAHANVPVFHIEAGLRSWNRAMPEEINRIVADSISSVLFTPTSQATQNLLAEGVPSKENAIMPLPHVSDSSKDDATPHRPYSVQVGDVMYDNALHFSRMAEKRSHILEQLCLTDCHFVLATIHRPVNADNMAHLTSIISALETIAEEQRIILPLHPRTKSHLSSQQLGQLTANDHISLIEPVSFLDMIMLERHASLILTDSGGVQKEAFFYGKPCVIFREETEWTEIVHAGAAILAGADKLRIIEAYTLLKNKQVHPANLYGDGLASEHIVKEISRFFSSQS